MTELDRTADSPRASLSNFSEYLAAQQSVLMEQWLMLIRRDPQIEAADRLQQHQLIDHVPILMKELCEFLRTRDAPKLFGEARRDAQTHGELRWQDGYRIDELLRELEALRRLVAASVFHYRDQDPTFNGPLEVSASVLVQQFFAEISVASVRQFMREQDNVTRSTVEDLTSAHQELGRSNAKLAQTMAERERETTMVAYEIRNFLQTLPGAFAAAADHPGGDLRGFLGQLLEYTELTGKSPELDKAMFKPAQLFTELIALYRPLAEHKGLHWRADAASAPERVLGDRLATKRIAEILLSNAIDNTREGRITLKFVEHDTERWTIRVEDTGPGLSDEASERLLSGTSATDQLPSRGFGLAIAKDLIFRLGGTWHAMTQSETGTRIDVTLPK